MFNLLFPINALMVLYTVTNLATPFRINAEAKVSYDGFHFTDDGKLVIEEECRHSTELSYLENVNISKVILAPCTNDAKNEYVGQTTRFPYAGSVKNLFESGYYCRQVNEKKFENGFIVFCQLSRGHNIKNTETNQFEELSSGKWIAIDFAYPKQKLFGMNRDDMLYWLDHRSSELNMISMFSLPIALKCEITNPIILLTTTTILPAIAVGVFIGVQLLKTDHAQNYIESFVGKSKASSEKSFENSLPQ